MRVMFVKDFGVSKGRSYAVAWVRREAQGLRSSVNWRFLISEFSIERFTLLS